MEHPPADWTLERLFSRSIGAAGSARASGIEKEVTELFDDLRIPVLRYLSSFGLSADDGEEVVQEVFLSLFLHLRDYKPRSNLRGWIFRVAHNLGLKRRERNHRVLKLVAHSNEYSSESHLDAGQDPEEHLSSAQRTQRLLAVVNALPELDRRCLYLRAEGLRYREIAQVLCISVGGVALCLTRSFARLMQADGR